MDKTYFERVTDLKNAWKKMFNEVLRCIGIKI